MEHPQLTVDPELNFVDDTGRIITSVREAFEGGAYELHRWVPAGRDEFRFGIGGAIYSIRPELADALGAVFEGRPIAQAFAGWTGDQASG